MLFKFQATMTMQMEIVLELLLTQHLMVQPVIRHARTLHNNGEIFLFQRKGNNTPYSVQLTSPVMTPLQDVQAQVPLLQMHVPRAARTQTLKVVEAASVSLMSKGQVGVVV